MKARVNSKRGFGEDDRQPLHRGVELIGFALIVAVALACSAASAFAAQTRVSEGTFGTVAQPTFGAPIGLAVDQSSGDLLVIDATADTVSRYHSDGTPANFSGLGTNVIDGKGGEGDQTPQNGFIFGSGGADSQIAVDSSGTSTNGNIYVTQFNTTDEKHLIDVFAPDGHYLGQLDGAGATDFGEPCGVSVDADGALYVGDFKRHSVFQFTPSAALPVRSDLTASLAASNVCQVAAGAGPSEGLLVYARFLGQVTRLDIATGNQRYEVAGNPNRTVGVDPLTGHALVVPESGPVAEYEFTGSSPVKIASFSAGTVRGVAADGASGKVYFSIGNTVTVYSPLRPLPDPVTLPATFSADTSATLRGTVDPSGAPLSSCEFEIGPTTAYNQTIPCLESPAEIGSGSDPVEVHADVSGLDEEALYHYRLVAANANGSVDGLDQRLKTPSKPVVVGQWAASVGLQEATLKAQINPENAATTFQLEWGTTAAYGQSTPAQVVGSDEADHVVSVDLSNLTPGVTYHYRFVATNHRGVDEGQDRTFTTFQSGPTSAGCPNAALRTGPSAFLPECRAYEMVSPVDKNGGDVFVTNVNYGLLAEAALSGNRATFSSLRAFAEPQAAPLISQYLSVRGPTGWATESITPPRKDPPIYPPGVAGQYKGFDEELCNGWLIQDSDLPLATGAPEGVANLYRRDLCGGGGYTLLSSVDPPGFGNGSGSYPAEKYFSIPQGRSADYSLEVFRADAKLTANACPNPAIFQIYERLPSGTLRLVSVRPDGVATCSHSTVGNLASGTLTDGFREGNMRYAVSEDGSTVFWTDSGLVNPLEGSSNGGGLGRIFARVNATAAQSKLGPDGKCAEPSKACTLEITTGKEPSGKYKVGRFWFADPAGTKALYTINDELFEFDVAGEQSHSIATGVTGLAGASEDLSRVYFVSTADLGGGENSLGAEARLGNPNLYLREGSAVTFLATLGADEGTADLGYYVRPSSPADVIPFLRTSRISADGMHLAFTSSESLTGYDNADVESGQPDVEVYLYDADPLGGPGALRCASCNPSGSRPSGRPIRTQGTADIFWAASTLPGWTEQMRPSRLLSPDGDRLFFQSFDSLVPRDRNEGVQDVYEWQRASGKNECDELGAEVFSAGAGGCISMISAGTGEEDTQLVDASADGSSVFFATEDSLVADDPGLADLYVARIGGGFPPKTRPVPCADEGCQPKPSPPPSQAPTSTAVGAGNPKFHMRSCPKGKHRVKRKGKVRCVKNGKKHHKQHTKRRAGR